MTSTFEKIIALGSDYVYCGRTTTLGGVTINSVGKWDGDAGTIQMVDNGVNNPTWGGLALVAGSGSNDIYVSGSFTEVGSSISANRIAYHNGTSWSTLNGATVFDNNVTSLAYDYNNNVLYAGSHQTTTVANRISMWNGTTWTGIAEPTVSSYTKMTVDNDGNLYVGYGTVLKRYLYQGSTWETLSSSIGGTISDVKYNSVDNRVYVVLYINSGSSIKYYDVSGESISAVTDLSGYPRAIAFDSNNNIFVACQSPSQYEGSIVRLDGGSWTNLYNYQNTSGVLDIEIDNNDNIFCYANSGSLTIGVAPYGNGDWEAFSSSTSINYGGIVVHQSNENVSISVGDSVCVKNYPTQHGIVIRVKPLGVSQSFVVKWYNGPLYSQNTMMAYFGKNTTTIELV